MARLKMLSWFEDRRKSRTLNLAQLQIMKAIDTVSELKKAIKSLSEGKRDETENAIKRLFLEEVEVDELRRKVFEELTKGSLPPKYREDLKQLIGRLDRLADYVKDSARSVKVLMETYIPKDIFEAVVNIADDLAECAVALGECIEVLGQDPSKAKDKAMKVDLIENRIDERYIEMKSLSMKHSRSLDIITLIELRDLTEFMEHAADMCADTADYVRVIATGEET